MRYFDMSHVHAQNSASKQSVLTHKLDLKPLIHTKLSLPTELILNAKCNFSVVEQSLDST